MSRFDDAYQGKPPWDIDRPQDDLVRIADRVQGSVLDVGCGTGENALFFAARGHEVWGVDFAPRAIEMARAKAAERGLGATFVVGDALELGELGRTFDNAIDSGLFHVFTDEERPRFVKSLASAIRPGGRSFTMCFSEQEPDWGGPRRVTQAEIRAAFRDGWTVESIEAARFSTNLGAGGARAWLVSAIRR